MSAQRRTNNAPAGLAEMLGGAAQPSTGALGQYVTAALLAAAEGDCTCETCQLMRRASKAMRAGLLES